MDQFGEYYRATGLALEMIIQLPREGHTANKARRMVTVAINAEEYAVMRGAVLSMKHGLLRGCTSYQIEMEGLLPKSLERTREGRVCDDRGWAATVPSHYPRRWDRVALEGRPVCSPNVIGAAPMRPDVEPRDLYGHTTLSVKAARALGRLRQHADGRDARPGTKGLAKSSWNWLDPLLLQLLSPSEGKEETPLETRLSSLMIDSGGLFLLAGCRA
jgi:hypothetical protein